ncbi:twin-arginine translocase TatA/TatE family subunit [bacterium DOLZORAL124_64_63]|nr:MAG: twin-arginine translocase TatA/TatE family subunit [bacterium DOLZORAL124_64_63]
MPFGGLGWPEIVVILVLVLIFFGPQRLPELAESVGKSLRRFKAATREASDEVKRELDDVKNDIEEEEPRAN